VATGKTDCVVKEENGEITLTVSKAVNPNSKSKRTPKVLINNCKLTAQGF